MPSSVAVHAALTFSTVCGWVSLVILAVAPSGAWPHTGFRGDIERAALYFIVAAITRATMTEHQTRWQIVSLAVMATMFEVGRAWIAGRSNGVAGWMSSTAGVIAGASLLRYVAHTHFRRWGR